MDTENRNYAPIAILLITAAIAGGIYMIKSGDNFFSRFFSGRPDVVSTLQTSLNGSLVKEFPSELILASDARIERSSVSRIDSQNLSIITASYSTKSKLTDLYGAYLNFLADKDFRVYLSDSKPGRSSIAAQGRDYNVGVSISFLAKDYYRVQIDVNKKDAANE